MDEQTFTLNAATAAQFNIARPIEGQVAEAFELIDLEKAIEDDLACQGPNHPPARFGHQAGAPAEYLVRYRCGVAWMMCGPWVAEVRRHDSVDCGLPHCRDRQPTDTLVVIPL